jgi:hypothetical protein
MVLRRNLLQRWVRHVEASKDNDESFPVSIQFSTDAQKPQLCVKIFDPLGFV